jgi:hypothetical protein
MSYPSAPGYPPLSVSPHYRRVRSQLVFSWLRPSVFPWASLAARFLRMSVPSVAGLCRVLRMAPAVLCTPQLISLTSLGLLFRWYYRKAAFLASNLRASWHRSASTVGASLAAICSWRLAFWLCSTRGFALTCPVPFSLFFFPSASAPNGRFEGTACKLRLQVPYGLRPPAAPQARR